MTENRQLEKARKWCQTLTLAHFSVVLDTATEKAVILWYDGRVCKDVPSDYQAGATALLRNGETFTAVSIQGKPTQQRFSQSFQRESSHHTPTKIGKVFQPFLERFAQPYRHEVSPVGSG
jgi:hypothetical protein